MKELFSVKRIVSVVALLLSVVMLFSACGARDTASNNSDLDSDSAVMNDSDDQNSKVDDQNNDASNDNSNPANKSSRPQNNGTTASGSTVFGPDPFANISANVKSKGVHVLMWRKYTPLEQKLVDDFQKKTGVKVRTTITTEQDYMTKLISMVAGNDAPDVCSLSSTGFPGNALKGMQVLDAKTFRLDDKAWYKNYMDYYRVNNRYFSVAMQGAWACEDCNYVTYYMPKVLRACQINEDPYTLYTKGQWNWDKQKEIATKIAKAGKDYIGISMQSNNLMMHSAGEDFVKFDGTQYTSSLKDVSSNSLLTQAWQQIADFTANNVIAGWALNNVKQGKVGLFTAIAYGMYNANTDAWFSDIPHTSADIKAVPVAGPKGKTAYTPVRPKTWGVGKKAKNPEGAAYFLRYFLDTSKCDMGNSFYNEQFKQVYSKITATNDKKSVMLGEGIVDYVTSGTYGKICNQLTNATSANVTTVLNSNKNSVNTGINRANKELKKVK